MNLCEILYCTTHGLSACVGVSVRVGIFSYAGHSLHTDMLAFAFAHTRLPRENKSTVLKEVMV